MPNPVPAQPIRNFFRKHGFLISATVLILSVFSIYRFHFAGPVIYSNDAWGTFGDYIGGTLNPLLSFLALIAIVKTMNIQKQELQKSIEVHSDNCHANKITSNETYLFKLIELLNIEYNSTPFAEIQLIEPYVLDHVPKNIASSNRLFSARQLIESFDDALLKATTENDVSGDLHKKYYNYFKQKLLMRLVNSKFHTLLKLAQTEVEELGKLNIPVKKYKYLVRTTCSNQFWSFVDSAHKDRWFPEQIHGIYRSPFVYFMEVIDNDCECGKEATLNCLPETGWVVYCSDCCNITQIYTERELAVLAWKEGKFDADSWGEEGFY